MALNVLLMLSSGEPPHPTKVEIPFHVKECLAGRTTYIITGKALGEVKPGKKKPDFPMTSGLSVVAFYGDKPLGNFLLAQGKFVSYIRFGSPEGKRILQNHGLYTVNNIPKKPKGFIEVRNLIAESPATTIDALNGIIESAGNQYGLALTVNNLPEKQHRLRVYYRCRT